MTHEASFIAGVEDIDCRGMTTLITGSTSGIGRQTAEALGAGGATVYVHGRDAQAGKEVTDHITRAGGTAEFFPADFTRRREIIELADRVREASDTLDLLINNAGGVFRSGQLTEIGVEYTFQVNHLAPFLLTAELVDQLNSSARVVTTASAAHNGTSLNLDRVRTVDTHRSFWAYSHSKLANILFTRELARRGEVHGCGWTANCVHPGAIPGSGFTRFLPGPVSKLAQALDRVPGVTSVAEGAAELLHVALSPRTDDISGRYFSDQVPTSPSESARQPQDANRLWRESASLLDIDVPLQLPAKEAT